MAFSTDVLAIATNLKCLNAYSLHVHQGYLFDDSWRNNGKNTLIFWHTRGRLVTA